MANVSEVMVEQERVRFEEHAEKQGLLPTPEYWVSWLAVGSFSHLESAAALLHHAIDATGNQQGSWNVVCDELIADVNRLRYPEIFVGDVENVYEWLDAVEVREKGLREMPYHAFLASPEWAEARTSALRRAGGRCQGCNSTARLQVHHRTYERRGQEEADDLTVLCHTCHRALHFHGGAHRPRERAR